MPHFDEAKALVQRGTSRSAPSWSSVGTSASPRADRGLIEANGNPCVDTIQRPHGRPIGGTRFGDLPIANLAADGASTRTR